MTILESAFEQVSDTVPPDKPTYHAYDIKIDIMLEEGTKTVHGKATISKTLFALEKAVIADGNTIEISDTDNTIVKPDLNTVKAADITHRFKAEVINAKSKVFIFGIKIKTTIPFAVIKNRIIPSFQSTKTYIKIHHGGFDHGVNWSNLGFFINEHPRFSQLINNNININEKFKKAWNTDNKYWTTEKKTK